MKVEMEFKKETKRTVVYAARQGQVNPPIESLYLEKSALFDAQGKDLRPKAILVTVEPIA